MRSYGSLLRLLTLSFPVIQVIICQSCSSTRSLSHFSSCFVFIIPFLNLFFDQVTVRFRVPSRSLFDENPQRNTISLRVWVCSCVCIALCFLIFPVLQSLVLQRLMELLYFHLFSLSNHVFNVLQSVVNKNQTRDNQLDVCSCVD